MQDRGLAAYIAELVGTLFLVFFITSAVTLFVATGNQAQFGSGLRRHRSRPRVSALRSDPDLRGVSGGHFNPAVTVAVAAIRKIDPIDAVIYILAQLSGAVLGALLTKALLVDEGRAGHYGAVQVSTLLGSKLQGFVVEGIGALVLVLAVLVVALGTRSAKEWAPLGDRHDAGLRGDGHRSAHRWLAEPGPLVRTGAGQQPLGWRLAVRARPTGCGIDRRCAVPLRDRGWRDRSHPATRSGRQARAQHIGAAPAVR